MRDGVAGKRAARRTGTAARVADAGYAGDCYRVVMHKVPGGKVRSRDERENHA
jgi:hypothetical protein